MFLDQISMLCCQDRDYCNRWLYPKLEVKPTGLFMIYVCPFNCFGVYLFFPTNIYVLGRRVILSKFI